MKILCLASSAKGGDICVAGIEVKSKRLVRPVREDTSEWELPREQCCCSTYGMIQKFDTFEINAIGECSKPYHPEDIIVDTSRIRIRDRGLDDNKMALIKDRLYGGSTLFGFVEKSKPVAEIEQNPLGSSLAIIQPKDVKFSVQTWERKKHRVTFTVDKTTYSNVGITDPEYFPIMDPKDDGTYSISDVYPESKELYFVVSLTEPYNDNCYMVIPSIIVIDGT